jgi:drug/metabolite transporter (DMT)-like permease
MWFLLAALSAIVFGAAGLFMKASQANGGNTNHLLFGLYFAGTIGFGIHSLFTPPSSWFHPSIWIAGLVIGVGSAWGNLIWMKALNYGPVSLSSLLSNMNIVLVILLATWWYGETVSILQWFGISALLTAITLISIRPGESWSIREKTWFLLITISILLFTIRNGGLKVTSELQMSSSAVLWIAYLLSTIWFAISVTRKSPDSAVPPSGAKIGLIWGLLAGGCSYGGLQLYALALESGPANIVAPIFATNSLIIAIGAILFFRERLTILQIIAGFFLLLGLILVRV